MTSADGVDPDENEPRSPKKKTKKTTRLAVVKEVSPSPSPARATPASDLSPTKDLVVDDANHDQRRCPDRSVSLSSSLFRSDGGGGVDSHAPPVPFAWRGAAYVLLPRDGDAHFTVIGADAGRRVRTVRATGGRYRATDYCVSGGSVWAGHAGSSSGGVVSEWPLEKLLTSSAAESGGDRDDDDEYGRREWRVSAASFPRGGETDNDDASVRYDVGRLAAAPADSAADQDPGDDDDEDDDKGVTLYAVLS